MTRNIVLIPYRNREKHLEYFLKHSAPKLKDELDNFELLIIEQSADNKLFNRGKLLNVGFDYCNDDEQEIYFFPHDVDINPLSDKTFKFYNKKIDNKSIIRLCSPNNPNKILESCGGTIKMSNKLFKKINGFPNNYWGWGAEDKNLKNRADYYKTNYINYLNKNNKKECFGHFLIFNDKDDRIRKNYQQKFIMDYRLFNKMNDKNKKKYILNSGLNNLKYKIIEEIKINDYCKKIIVEI